MLKFLLILFLIGYVFFKVGGFLFRTLLGGLGAKTAYQYTQSRNQQERQHQKRSTTRDGVSIDYAPDNKDKRSAANFKGGEYVDYEEI